MPQPPARHLVAFDVDAIKEYVFGAVRPIDVAGASWIVEEFTEHVRRKLPGVIYAGGGNGMLEAPSREEAERLAKQLEGWFSEMTAGAGSCTTAVAGDVRDGHPGAGRERVWAELARRKAERAAREPLPVLVPAGTPLCQACGREPGRELSDPHADERYLGRQCERRRQQGQAARNQPRPWARGLHPAVDLNHLFGPGPAGGGDAGQARPEREAALAAVYLDADGAGELVRRKQEKHLRRLAGDLQEVTRAALYGSLERLNLDGRFIAPVVGGDDVLVFLDSASAPALLRRLWEGLEPLKQKWGLTFSAAVTLAPVRSPLKLLLQRAERDLREAKRAAAAARRAGSGPEAGAEPWVAVTSLLGNRLHDPSAPLFGGPLPQRLWAGGGPSVQALTRALAGIGRAQRAGMAADLAQPSQELAWLDLEYRASAGRRGGAGEAGEAVEHALEQAARLAAALSRARPDLPATRDGTLRSGLVAAEAWGQGVERW